jgi:hypothetical protein
VLQTYGVGCAPEHIRGAAKASRPAVVKLTYPRERTTL